MPSRMFAVEPEDARALSPAEMQMRDISLLGEARGAQLSIAQMLALQNYRRPVHVPPGMADWYACGDELP